MTAKQKLEKIASILKGAEDLTERERKIGAVLSL